MSNIEFKVEFTAPVFDRWYCHLRRKQECVYVGIGTDWRGTWISPNDALTWIRENYAKQIPSVPIKEYPRGTPWENITLRPLDISEYKITIHKVPDFI